jgi:hypothetical protein
LGAGNVKNLKYLSLLSFLVLLLFFTNHRAKAQAGTALGNLASSMQPGTWASLSTSNITPTLSNTGGSSNMIFGYAESARWDAASRKVFYLGSDHGGNPTPGPNSGYRFVSYDEGTNSWGILPNPPWVTINSTSYTDAHGYDHTALDPAGRTLYRRAYGSNVVHTYNIDSGVWSLLPAAPNTGTSCCDGLEYFPDLGGLVWNRGTDAVLFYKPSTQQWSILGQNNGIFGTWLFAEYNPIHRLMLIGAGNHKLYKISSSGQLSALKNSPVTIEDASAWSGITTVDPVSGDYLVLTSSAHQLYVYNVLTDTWTLSPNQPPSLLVNTGVVAAPISRYGVTMFTYCKDGTCGVLLYKHSSSAGVPAVPADTTPPTVSWTAPANGSAVSGSSVSISVSATDNVGVAGVQFKLNGANLGSENTTAPYSKIWDTTQIPNGSYVLSAVARDAMGNRTTSTGPTVSVSNVSSTPVSPTPPADTTFSSKCTQSGVINCFSFDNQNQLYYAWPSPSSCDQALGGQGYTNYQFNQTRQGPGNTIASNYNQTGSCVYPTVDTTMLHSGNGALKFTIPSNSGEDTSGSFTEPFKRNADGTFSYIAPGSPLGNVVYMQFYQRFDPNFLTTVYKCGSNGSEYCGGWKQLIWYGNPPNGSSSSTIEVTHNNGWLHGMPTMYGQQGADDYGYQDIRGCAFNFNGMDTYPEPPCIRYKPNQWMEFTVRVEVRGARNAPESRVQLWVDGQLTVDYGKAKINWGSSDGQGLGSFEITPFHTRKWSGQTTPVGYTWVDDVIISTSPIAMRSGSTSPTTPTDTISPSTSTNVVASAVSSSQINVSWAASTDNVGVIGYRIYRCQGAGCTPTTQVATSNTTSYSDTGLSANTSYAYGIAAYDGAGNVSIKSSSAVATTQQASSSGTPYPASSVIARITWDMSTYRSAADGSDLWPTTWGPDDNVYASWGDGNGFGSTDAGLGFAKITGSPETFSGTNLWTRPRPGGKSAGIISVKGTFYAFINSQDGTFPDVDYDLAYSTDMGLTWQFALSMFPKGAGNFQPNSFVQFGKDYAGARDTYVYVLGGMQGFGESEYLARVPATQVPVRSSYEFVSGFDSNGNPQWSTDQARKVPVFTDTSSQASSALGHMVYNPGIHRYILTTARSRNAAKQSVFDAPEPWGPWTTVAYYDNWLGMTGGEQLGVSFPGKWTSADGLTMWSVFAAWGSETGIYHDKLNLMKATLTLVGSPNSPSPLPTPAGTISNLSVMSGKIYQPSSLTSGSMVFTDRGYTFGTIPSALSGQLSIRTANDDKATSPSSPLVTFTVNQDSWVYILYTNFNSTIDTTWLTSANSWTLDSFNVPSTLNGTEANRLVRHKFYKQNSTVILNGNGGLSDTNSMYTVVIVPGSATSVTSPPSVSITAPSEGATVSGSSVTLSAAASGNTGLVGVQFQVDDANLGAEDTFAPYSVSWDTRTVLNGPHRLTAIARDTAGYRGASPIVSVTVNNVQSSDTTGPSISISSPANAATVSGIVTVSANASDNVGVAGVQFQVDGANLGPEDTSVPYTSSWNTNGLTGSHTLTVVARDAAGNRATSAPVSVTIADTVPPFVSVTNPAASSTVSGTIMVAAAASDNVAVAGVQFKLDGVNLGAEITAPPYSLSWNSKLTSNGNKSITAEARDMVGNRKASNPVTITVSNASNTMPQPTGSYSVPDNGTLSWITSSAPSPVRIGGLRLQPDVGRTVPMGVAVLGYRNGDTLVSEAGVPACSPMQSGRIYVDIGGPVNTGIAFANPGNEDALISFYFTDANGTDFGQKSFTLKANRQFAAFLNEDPFNSPATSQGTFTFNSTVPVGAVALRLHTNERSEFLMSNLPVSPLGTESNGSGTVVPHFADGGGWTTQIILTNPTEATLSGTVQFFEQGSVDQAAELLTLTVSGVRASTFNYEIPPRSMTRLTTSSPSSTKVGSVRINPTGNGGVPVGLAILSFAKRGITVSEASVPATHAGSRFRIYVESDGKRGHNRSAETGLAIANPSSASATVHLELTNADGASTGLSTSLTVPGDGQVARFINDFLPGLPAGFRGLLRLTADSPIVTIGLRGRYNERGDFLFTTTPSAEEGVSSGSQILFPHVPTGGGYSTQFIMFNSTSGTSSGKVWFLSGDGEPITDVNLTTQ